MAAHVAEMDIGQHLPASVTSRGFINIAARHLLKGADAEFQRIGVARREREQPVIFLRPVHEPRRAAQALDRWVVGMSRQTHPRLLGHRHELPEEPSEALPQLLLVNPDRSRGRVAGAVAHVPNHAVRDGCVSLLLGKVHDDCHCAAAGRPALAPSPYAGNREIVADHRDARPPGIAHQPLEVLYLPGTVWAVEQNVGPEGRREVFERRDPQPVPCEHGCGASHRLVVP